MMRDNGFRELLRCNRNDIGDDLTGRTGGNRSIIDGDIFPLVALSLQNWTKQGAIFSSLLLTDNLDPVLVELSISGADCRIRIKKIFFYFTELMI